MAEQRKTTTNLTRRSMIAAVGAGTLGSALAAQQASAQGSKPKAFDPNRLTFEEGIERIKDAVGSQTPGEIVTSQDKGIDRVVDALEVTNIPDGFVKYQLPVAIEGGPGAQFFLSIGHPKTSVKPHSHDEGDGMRFVVSGSIKYDGKVLRGGDWMYIPKGSTYSFDVGDQGAVIFYCYSCCCA